MKKIVITQRLVGNESYNETRDALDIRWAPLFFRLNYLPIILPTLSDFRLYFDELNIGGVLLTGGNDLARFSDNELSRRRDVFERDLLRFALEREIPIMGVCRGMQLIGEYFRANLMAVNGHISTRHRLTVSDKSKFVNDLKKIDSVNSYHSYVLSDVPNEFIVSATSEDGAIEAIEHRKYKVFCQMWHPERETSFDMDQLTVMKHFFEETNKTL